MNQCRRFIVSGRVQGVFFRTSTQEEARRLGVTGWVSNRHDGRVELLACGNAELLDELERWLNRGPSQARVERVDSEAAPGEGYQGFSIR